MQLYSAAYFLLINNWLQFPNVLMQNPTSAMSSVTSARKIMQLLKLIFTTHNFVFENINKLFVMFLPHNSISGIGKVSKYRNKNTILKCGPLTNLGEEVQANCIQWNDRRQIQCQNQEVKADSIPFSNRILNRIHSCDAIFVSPVEIWRTVKVRKNFVKIQSLLVNYNCIDFLSLSSLKLWQYIFMLTVSYYSSRYNYV